MFRGFTQKKVNSYTLGEQLKKLRSECRITIGEVARETKVPLKYIEMIEEGKYSELPPDVYVKGFLKAYAQYLGIDEKKIIDLYQREKDIRDNLQGNKQKKAVKKKPRLNRLVITPSIFIASVVFLVTVGGFSYLYGQIDKFASVPRLVIVSPAADETISGNSISVSGFTDEDAKLTINNQPVLVSDKGEFKENILLQKGVNVITISAVNRFNKEISKTLNVKADYQVPEVAEGDDQGRVIGEQDTNKNKVNVVVRADTDPVWLSVESDGNLVYSGTMLPGAVQSFDGEREIRLTSGKANKTFIRVNGKDERILDSSPGIVRDVVFTVVD